MNAKDLIHYTHTARRRYLTKLRELPWDVVIKDREASFSLIRDIFIHTLNMVDNTINYIIPGKSEDQVSSHLHRYREYCRPWKVFLSDSES